MLPLIYLYKPRLSGSTDFVFILIDWLGAFFSLLSVITQTTFDVLGGVLYIVWYVPSTILCLLKTYYLDSIVLELGIFVSQGIWLLRTYKIRKQAKLNGKNFDDLPEARKYQYDPAGKAPTSTSRSRDIESGDVEPGQLESGNIDCGGAKIEDKLSNELESLNQRSGMPSREATEAEIGDFKA